MSQQINLFNPVFLKQKKHFSVLTMAQALGLILIGCVVFYGYAWYQVKQFSAQVQEMGQRYAAEQEKLAKRSGEYSPERAKQLLDAEVKQLEAQAVAQERILSALKGGTLGNTEGYSEYMRAFARQVVNGLWLTSFDIAGDGAKMDLDGATTDPQLVPLYIQRLRHERIMRGKTFATLQMQRPKLEAEKRVARYVEFRLKSVPAEEGEKK